VKDIVITKIIEPDQTVVVLAGEGYVAVEVDYGYIGAEKSTVPEAVVLFSLAGAERMRYALGSAVILARDMLGVAGTIAEGE
jgi:hypothetical protein